MRLPAAVHAIRVRAPGGTAVGPGAARRRWLARTTNGASLKVRRIVNRAGKRKPTALHGAGSGGFDKECHGRSVG
ncbi:hypothetical protein KDW19_25230 [Burkholderia cenocepacia]|uniref:hypothetical protein n=1 Tax=Burkholderia cepacia complex TaxID=87882 RepID=UPI000F585F74|nr:MULTISPECIES: hypothetical protein [Burkholderia cepacia complex]ELW9449616.1 hypothetical protein [Burkholderia cenocepacia]MBR8299076.1 hypothetical protein [Burkholderia cenocepacia]MBR8485767.1 hypothetical protein [Burkholderia cenocepacia]MDN7472484.1 hypothetical protein [Burkholderia orbicola]MDN7506268.1 hypothetical protein [Burkholderia orbicola]